jgi:hypothetical protein
MTEHPPPATMSMFVPPMRHATCSTGFHQMGHWIWMNGVLVIHLKKRNLNRTHVVQEIIALRQQMQGTASTMSMFARTTFHAHR